MWVSVVPGTEGDADLVLPPHLWQGPPETAVYLRYGAGEAQVRVAVRPGAGSPGAGSRPDHPAPLAVSPRVIRQLYIRTEPVYRCRHTDGGIEIGPVIGMLLGNRNHWYTHEYLSREPERVTGVYPRTGGLFCAFSPRNVSLLEWCAYGLFYDPGAARWRYGPVPLPAVIQRRSFHCDPAAPQRLQRATGARIFNSRRYDKWQLFELLRREPVLRRHVPETVQVTDGQEVLGQLQRHRSVVLKPAALSRGRGILFVERKGRTYQLIDCRDATAGRSESLSRAGLLNFLDSHVVRRRYLSQQRIHLARLGDSPFDVRVVMQRNPRGHWRCNGIECRVAGEGWLVTNIAFGGTARNLADTVVAAFGGRLSPDGARGMVVSLSERLCYLLDRTGETFAELGVDIGLDRSGKAWLIEANVLPTFKGFQAMDPDTYRRLLAAPLLYAAGVAGFGEEHFG